MKHSKFTLSFILSFFLLFSNFAKAQSDSDNQALAALGILYLANGYDSDDKSFFATNKYGVSDLLIEKLEIPIDEMETGDFRVLQTGESQTLFYKKEEGLLRPYDIIVKTDRYYLLSPYAKSDICDYKANTVLFIPEKNYLKYVETPFSFSLRKDLAKKLDEELGIEINPKDFGRFCEMLAHIKNQVESRLD